MDSEPQVAEKLKAIRDKKERFFEPGKGRFLTWVPNSIPATGG
jgi:hypothetical protein